MFGLAGIWMLLGVPLVVSAVLLLFWAKKTKWWELILLWGVSILAISSAQLAVNRYEVSDKEWWGFNGVKAYYDEPYEYWTTCTETYICGSDSKGNPQTCTRTYPCTEWAGDEAFLIDQYSGARHISKAKYNQLAARWKENKFVELNRPAKMNIETDGDRWTTKWDGNWLTSEPIVEQHTYENKTQCSSTIRFREVDDKTKAQYGLFDYPEGGTWGYEMVSVLDQSGKHWAKGDKKFRYLNGVIGPLKKVRLWVFIFRDKPRDAAFWQKDYLKNGNKNEIILCIGANKAGVVEWVEVISWTDRKAVQVEARSWIEENIKEVSDESLVKTGDYIETLVKTKYVKPDFTKKYGHLAVQPSTGAMVVVAIIIILVNVGTAVFIIMNDFKDEDSRRARAYRSLNTPKPKVVLGKKVTRHLKKKGRL